MSGVVDAESLRSLAIQAARAGGELARAMRTSRLDVRLKHDGSEVSDADLRVQELVERTLLEARAHDRILGEETIGHTESRQPGTAHDDDAIRWIIDPIDGTRNYVRGLPGYGCAVAAMQCGRPIAAATFDVTDNRMYSGSIGGGFFVDGIAFSREQADARRGRTARLLIAVPSGVAGEARRLIDSWFTPHLLRNYGAAALHLCYIAAGGLDAMLAADCRLWDLAGGALFVDLMGGRIARLDGSPLFPFDVDSYDGRPLPSLFARDAPTYAALIAPVPT